MFSRQPWPMSYSPATAALKVSYGAWQAPPQAPSLGPADVHLWLASTDRPSDSVEVLWKTLSPDEQIRAERYRVTAVRNRFILRRGILRALLGSYLGIAPERLAFAYGANGKPELADMHPDTPIQFNLADSDGLVLYAVTLGRRVGVDLERIRPIPDAAQIAKQFFTLEERTQFETCPPDQAETAFWKLWTRKEALGKATGDGLVPSVRATKGWSVQELTPAPGFVSTVVMEGDGFRPTWCDWTCGAGGTSAR